MENDQRGSCQKSSDLATTTSPDLAIQQTSIVGAHMEGKGLLVTAESSLQLGDPIRYVLSPSVTDSVQYAMSPCQTLQSHVPDSEIISPQFVLIEDPISLHSYADFSGNLSSNFTNPTASKVDSVADLEAELTSSNFKSFASSGCDIGAASVTAEATSIVTMARSSRADTILSVPVINTKKNLSFQMSSSNTEEGASCINNTHLNDFQSIELIVDAEKSAPLVDKHSKNDSKISNADSSRLFEEHGYGMGRIKPQQDSSAVGKHFPNSTDAGTNTEDEITYPDFDTDDIEFDSQTQNNRDKLLKEKTAFSENLGLVPAEIEMKILAEKAKYAAVRGVRTRRSTEISLTTLKTKENVVSEDSSDDNARDHSCLPAVLESLKAPAAQGSQKNPACYRCGSCGRMFPTICKLHDHLQDHCFSGSYHYDHLLKTAFPKYDTACCYTQTYFDIDNEPFQEVVNVKKPVVVAAKVKNKKLKVKFPSMRNFSQTAEKRKRGRPRKVDILAENILSKNVKKEQNGETDFMFEKFEDSFLDMDDDVSDGTDVAEPSKDLNLTDKKEDEHVFNTDGSAFDTLVKSVETDGKFNENAILENRTEGKETFLNGDGLEPKKDVQNEFAKLENQSSAADFKKTKTEHDNEVKKTRKRKMSIPRKVMQTFETEKENDQIVNSRSKPDSKIKCEFCSSEFQYTRGLIRHEQEKHADQMKFNCDECDQKFMREYNLERHKLCTHTVGKSKFIQNRKGIYRGKKRIKSKDPEESPGPTVKCNLCPEEVPENKMDLHLRIHTGERPFICHVCGKGLISEKKLKRHLLIHSKINRYKCEECGQGFSMKYKLRTHMFLHTGHKPYLCSVCGAEFNNSTSLLHHNRTVHLGDKRFECTICGGKYGKKSQLEEHMFRHSDERTQTCRYCGKTFKHAKSLRRHEQTHISDQKFQCDQCDSKFSRKDNLDRHKMCHFDATLQCSFCKKKFVDRQLLVEHEEFHIKQLKYTCQICKERFQDETYFYNHMEKTHGLTQEMVPVVNTVTSPVKEAKPRRSGGSLNKNNIFDQLKVPSSFNLTETMGISVPQSSAVDTLNLSMSVAGILPATPSGQELRIAGQESMRVDQQSQNNLLQQVFSISNNTLGLNINASRHMLNQAMTSNYVSSSGILPGMNDAQRMALNAMSVGENRSLRLPADQGAAMALNPEHVILQEVVEAGIQNLEGQGYNSMMY